MKYELVNPISYTSPEGYSTTLYQIKALFSFEVNALNCTNQVLQGQLGGYVESTANLDQVGNSWIFDTAKVYQGGYVSGNAVVIGDSRIFNGAQAIGNAVLDDGILKGDVKLVSGEGQFESKECDHVKFLNTTIDTINHPVRHFRQVHRDADEKIFGIRSPHNTEMVANPLFDKRLDNCR